MKRALLIFLIVFIVMQLIRPTQQNAKETIKDKEIVVDSEVMQIFKTSCYDCHSNIVIWPWYSKIAPFSWIIDSHVKNGKSALNFSIWQEYSKEEKEKKLKSIYKKIYASMPLKSYTTFHQEAELSKEQREFIRAWTGVKR